ncbi:MAG: PorT family protein [Bacteroidales bacterium]|nr:PorT family protein [Bacteroidales bacterium]
MKKLFVFAIATMFAFSMSAQKFGVKVGYGMSGYTVNFYTPDGAKMASGFNAGLVGEMPVNDMMNLRVDLGYNQFGSDYYMSEDVGGTNMTTDFKTDVSYLNIGVSPKFAFGPAYVFVGPYFGYALSNVTNGTVTVGDVVALEVTDLDNFGAILDGGTDDLYSKTDFGLNLGFGANFSGVFVELNAGMGLANFINQSSQYYSATNYATKDDNTVAITGDAAQKNLFFGFSVGYMLGGE